MKKNRTNFFVITMLALLTLASISLVYGHYYVAIAYLLPISVHSLILYETFTLDGEENGRNLS